MAEREASEPRTIVITGASSGFGRGVAERLAGRGDRVVLAARRTELIERLATVLPDSLAVTADVADATDLERLRDEALARFGSIDVWINNAGAGAVGDFTTIPIEDHRRTIETTLIGVVNGCHVAIRYFESIGRGTVVNVGSTGGYLPFPYFSSYVAAKAGVVALGRVLQLELKERKLDAIHVSTVNPWVTDTPWFAHAGNYTGHDIQMPMPDDPSIVVDAIVKMVDDPKDSIDVGPSAKASGVAESVLPKLTERVSAHVVGEYMENAVQAVAPTSGHLHESRGGSDAVAGDMRERMRTGKKRDR